MEFSKIYNRDEFLNFLRRDFLPDDFLQVNEPVVFATKTTYSKQATKLGVCKSLDLIVYEIKHSGKDDPRVGLSKEAFRMLSEEWQSRALVLFVPENNANNYRFSLIEIKLEGDQTLAKVHRKYSNPRRYSYLLGEGIGGYTPNKYLAKGKIRENDEKDLLERFSVEVLTKAFYNELSDWYAWAVKVIKFPNNINDRTDDDKFNHECAIRLITRLIFVWFLKQKKLVPDEFFDEVYIRENLLANFNPHTQVDLWNKSSESKYYKAILQNLFFAMLNSPITPEGKDDILERRFSKQNSNDHNNKKLMRYEGLFINPQLFVDIANRTVPFLNGGLFDCLDEDNGVMYIDGFSDRKVVYDSLVVPDYLFFGEEIGKDIDLSDFYGDVKKKKVSARGVIDILKRYNFTVEENTPFDQEVSLDPELLGKVFENLLASYNPETKTTARKQTGSFYTPREIVQYMVDESLVVHLKRTVGEDLEEEYRKLMRYTDEDLALTDLQKEQIMLSLFNCKVLDPACGSGAFPVGMLQQMVHILIQLDPDNTKWREILMQNAIDETSEAYKTSSNDDRRENIADIERSFNEQYNAPDYARKLYLIENAIFGVDIQPIAVQISKLRFFISLVVDQKPNDNAADNFGIRPLPNLEAKFVAANTLIGLNKKDVSLFYTDEIRAKEKELREAKHKIFGAKTSKTKRKYKDVVKTLRVEISQILNGLGAIGSDEAGKLASWDMFDQNAHSPFFDPEWMFGVSDGFDIVIGNPPYIQLQANKGLLAKLYQDKKYKTFFRTGDLYCLFFERAHQILAKNGVLSFINPNTWLQSITFSPFREFVTSNFCWNKILITEKVFDATVDTHCIVFTKSIIGSECLIYSQKDDKFEYLHTIGRLDISNTSSTINIQANPRVSMLVKKIKERSLPLSDLYVIFNGVKPFEKGKGNPPQTTKTMEEKPFVKEGAKPGNAWLPLMRGSLMNRYVNLWDNNYWILYGEWLAAPRQSEIFKVPEKIIVRQTGDSIIATIIGENIICRNNLHICIHKQNINNHYILGLLNSKLTNFFYSYLNPEKGEALAEVKKNHVESLPIVINKNAEKGIGERVSAILAAKRLDIQADTSAIETEIDLMVYKLYGLTYNEVLVIDPQTPITQQQYEK